MSCQKWKEEEVQTETPGTTAEGAAVAEEASLEAVLIAITAAEVEEASLARARGLATTLVAEVTSFLPRFLLWRWQWW